MQSLTSPTGYTLSAPEAAFDAAIHIGVLVPEEDAITFAGRYMYMYDLGGRHYFKSRISRSYISCPTMNVQKDTV